MVAKRRQQNATEAVSVGALKHLKPRWESIAFLVRTTIDFFTFYARHALPFLVLTARRGRRSELASRVMRPCGLLSRIITQRTSSSSSFTSSSGTWTRDTTRHDTARHETTHLQHKQEQEVAAKHQKSQRNDDEAPSSKEEDCWRFVSHD